MWEAPDFYFDSISQIHMDRWSTGRTVLLGDAAYGATMGGMGTGLAVVGAYVLAGEIAAAEGDYRAVFEQYEELLRDYVAGAQKLGEDAGTFLTPSSRFRIWLRNQVLRFLAHMP